MDHLLFLLFQFCHQNARRIVRVRSASLYKVLAKSDQQVRRRCVPKRTHTQTRTHTPTHTKQT